MVVHTAAPAESLVLPCAFVNRTTKCRTNVTAVLQVRLIKFDIRFVGTQSPLGFAGVVERGRREEFVQQCFKNRHFQL